MSIVRISWIDSVSPGVISTVIYRDDIQIADIANGVQTYDDTTALEDTTYKYEVQAKTSTGESTDEVIGVNVENITTSVSGIWDIQNATYNNEFYVVNEADVVRGLQFLNNDMYVCGDNNIWQYNQDNLNISNSTYTNKTGVYSGTGDRQPMYQLLVGDKVFTFNANRYLGKRILNTNYDISTISSSQQYKVFNSQVTLSSGVWMSENGMSCILSDRGTFELYLYTLTSPFDIDTMTYSGTSKIIATGTIQAWTFWDSGKKVLSTSINGLVTQSTLIIPYDITTLTIDYSVDFSTLAGGLSQIYSIAYSEDGNRVYLGKQDTNTVYQFNL